MRPRLAIALGRTVGSIGPMRKSALLAVGLVVALVPASASAATTVGSSLDAGGGSGYCSGDSPGTRCTVLQLTLGTVDQAVPADGVITKWSVRDAMGELA